MLINETFDSGRATASLTDEELRATAEWLHRARSAPASALRDDALSEWMSTPEAADPRVWKALDRIEGQARVRGHRARSGASAVIARIARRTDRSLRGPSGTVWLRSAVLTLVLLYKGAPR
jgi:hypothetical protein